MGKLRFPVRLNVDTIPVAVPQPVESRRRRSEELDTSGISALALEPEDGGAAIRAKLERTAAAAKQP